MYKQSIDGDRSQIFHVGFSLLNKGWNSFFDSLGIVQGIEKVSL